MSHHDEEHGVSMASVPPAVQAAAKKAAGSNEIEEIKHENEDGQDVYEVEFDVGDVDHTVAISPAGEVVEEETEVKVADLPAAVSAAVLKAQPLAHVKEAARVQRGGQSFYEVDAKVGEDKHELAIADDGKLISDKAEAEHDDKSDHHDKD